MVEQKNHPPRTAPAANDLKWDREQTKPDERARRRHRTGAALAVLAGFAALLLSACGGGAAPATATFPPPPSLEVAALDPTPTHRASSPAAPEVDPPPAVTPDAAYPAATTPPTPYPPAATQLPTPGRTGRPAASTSGDLFLPLLGLAASPTPTPSITPVPSPTPIPTLDFAALRREIEARGEALVTSKIGFHVAVGGNRNGLGEWMRRLDEAGVPFFLKTVADTGPLVEAQELIRKRGVPHVLVYRFSGDEFDTPNYKLPPAEAAREHWERHVAIWPPELDKNLVWFETINEVDKNHSEWLGQFALATAALAERDGFKWAAFGWSSGEPEVEDWQQPSMLAFLRLAGANPDRLAIALHEYSYLADEIGHQYPSKVGRFQQLFQVVDAYGIPRPTVLITEWGWEYNHVPSIDRAMRDIAWANRLYAPYPEIKGAAIWYLGGGFGEIADKAQKLIYPVMVEGLTTYNTAPLPPERAPVSPDLFRP